MATTFVGIDFPITRDSNGYFARTTDAYTAAKVNLENLLRSKKGERRFQPYFGSDLWSVLFDNSIEEIDDAVENAVANAVSLWMPEIKLNSIEITKDYDNYKVSVLINFSLKNAPSTSENLNLTFTNVGQQPA